MIRAVDSIYPRSRSIVYCAATAINAAESFAGGLGTSRGSTTSAMSWNSS
ncbi:hypothetical protein [Actinomadura rugatobispora]|uniref:Uncharacterized protein n=1 Tax=Actinomadura rugatobispora TaxID=1994 RepID=A0ABW0ZN52_9ACTN